MSSPADPAAWFGPWLATEMREVSHDPAVLDEGGRWAVSITFEGQFTAARFGSWSRREENPAAWASARRQLAGAWRGPAPRGWTSSLDQPAYESAVAATRDYIAAGDVYQANICRVLRADLPAETARLPRQSDVAALSLRLEAGNPAPHGGMLRLPEHGVLIASASPELYLRRRGERLWSRPIKGTGQVPGDLQEKDHAENLMIVDLVRNDLARVARPGSVIVDRLCAVEAHPGLVHLVSQVRADLRRDVAWSEILAATFPPGSVSGAPTSSALRIISELEAGPRGPYCGAFGWVDADRREAELAVAIRTFWVEGDAAAPVLAFGTGAGITWGSEPAREWAETELKAARLIGLAGLGSHPG